MSIAMTAPVVQARTAPETIATSAPMVQINGSDEWTIRFPLPRVYSLE